MAETSLNLGSVIGPDAFTVWCGRQEPVLDPSLGSSWDAYMAAIKGAKGDTGAPGADGLTEAQVDARVADAITGKQDTLTFDALPTDSSDNPVKSGGVYTALAAKQDALEWDSVPTEDSVNPVTSGGVYAAISAADIGDTGWVEIALAADARILSGRMHYRVKNGVLWIAGSVAVSTPDIFALTSEAIPSNCIPPVMYNMNAYRIRANANSIWLEADLWLSLPSGLIYKGGVIDHRTAGGAVSGSCWLTIFPFPIVI